jgi:hypothetical protein
MSTNYHHKFRCPRDSNDRVRSLLLFVPHFFVTVALLLYYHVAFVGRAGAIFFADMTLVDDHPVELLKKETD